MKVISVTSSSTTSAWSTLRIMKATNAAPFRSPPVAPG